MLAGAESDMLGHYIHFEEVNPGLGDRFYARLDESLGLLANLPEMAPAYIKPFRRLLMRGFPLGVFYVLEHKRTIIHAILDLRQAPETIKRRLLGWD